LHLNGAKEGANFGTPKFIDILSYIGVINLHGSAEAEAEQTLQYQSTLFEK